MEQILDKIENAEDGLEALIMPSLYSQGYPFKAIFRDTDAGEVITVHFFTTQEKATETARGWVFGEKVR